MTEQEQDRQIAFDCCCDAVSKLNDIVAAVTAVTAATALIAKNLEEVSHTVHAVGVLTEKPGMSP
jgi:hypothetical protein